MPQVSAVSCFRVSGTGRPQSQRVQTFGITGVDGVGVHLLGDFGVPITWLGINYGTAASLQTWYESLVDEIGNVVTITNDEGQSFTNQLIENVSEPQKRTAVDFSGVTELWTVTVTSRTV
jgi:hypothetical protein